MINLPTSNSDKPAAKHGGEDVGAALRAAANPRVRAQLGHLWRRRRRGWQRRRPRSLGGRRQGASRPNTFYRTRMMIRFRAVSIPVPKES